MSFEPAGDLLPRFLAELAYLRNAGADFARAHPTVAASLDISDGISTDPQIQRLIESFAFLTAKLQRNYEAQFPEIPEALLGVLYPQMVAPVPSMAIARFVTDPKQSRAVAGVTAPAGSTLFTELLPGPGIPPGTTCRFRTAYSVTLWPIEVVEARLEPRTDHPFLDRHPDVRSVVRIRLRCLGHRSFDEFAPPSLRFFIAQGNPARERIYELLFAHLVGIATAAVSPDSPLLDGPAPEPGLCRGARLEPVGFGADEDVLPCRNYAHRGYGLLQELFAFPDKFLFFDVTGLTPGVFGKGTDADLLLLLGYAPHAPLQLDRHSLLLGCTPILNLFPRISEPIRLDHTKLEYRLVADSRREATTEIHSIERLTRSALAGDRAREVRPLFSVRHGDDDQPGASMYWARRLPARNPAFEGSDMLLSFVDPALDLAVPAWDTVFAHVQCTNRGLAVQVPAGTPLNVEMDLPLSHVTCLTRPTRQGAAPVSGETLWRLVSHLSVNHLSLAGGGQAAAVLQEVLRLHVRADDAKQARRIAGLVSVSALRIVRRLAGDAWRGYCRGFEVNVAFKEASFSDGSAYLTGAVLSRFFALYVAANTFTELVMTNEQSGEHWRWPAMTGDSLLL